MSPKHSLTADTLRTGTGSETATHFAHSPAPPVNMVSSSLHSSLPTSSAEQMAHQRMLYSDYEVSAHPSQTLSHTVYPSMIAPSHSLTSQPMGASVLTVARRRGPAGDLNGASNAATVDSCIDEEGGYPLHLGYSTYEDEALVRLRESKVARRTRRTSFGRGVQSANNGWMTTCLFCLVLVMIGAIVVGTLYMTQMQNMSPGVRSETKARTAPPVSPPSVPSLPTLLPSLEPIWEHFKRQDEALQRLNKTLTTHLNTHFNGRSRLRASNRTHTV